MSNMAAAREVEKECGVAIVVIKKTSPEYDALQERPACPSVAVNGMLIAKNDIVTVEQLRAAILK